MSKKIIPPPIEIEGPVFTLSLPPGACLYIHSSHLVEGHFDHATGGIVIDREESHEYDPPLKIAEGPKK